MMNKRKKYLLGTLFVFLSLIVTLSQVSIWENHLKSTLIKKINQYDWNLNVDELSGNFISTIFMKDLIFEKENGERIIIDKISINLGIFSSLIGETVFDLIAIEGLELDSNSDDSGNSLIKAIDLKTTVSKYLSEQLISSSSENTFLTINQHSSHVS